MLCRPVSRSSHHVTVLVLKFSACLTLLNLCVTLVLLVTKPQNITVVQSLYSRSSNGEQLDDQTQSKIVRYTHWLREALAEEERDSSLNPDAVKNARPNVPLRHFTQSDLLDSDYLNASEVRRWMEPTGFYQQIMQSIMGRWDVNQAVKQSKNAADSTDSFLSDIGSVYFSVRTTHSNYFTRLALMLDTWITVARSHVRIVADVEDKSLLDTLAKKFEGQHPKMIFTDCPQNSHSKWALLCKTYWEFQEFLRQPSTQKSWFCHFDDDTFVNVHALLAMLRHFNSNLPFYIGRSPSQRAIITRVYDTKSSNKPQYLEKEDIYAITDKSKLVAFHFALGGAGYCLSRRLVHEMAPYLQTQTFVTTAASISLPDDCVIGYIITHLLNVSLTDSDVMHSQFEPMTSMRNEELIGQVTFSFNQSQSFVSRIAGDYNDLEMGRNDTVASSINTSYDYSRIKNFFSFYKEYFFQYLNRVS
ncbi:unnamed protein product [Clavelina lepadiformis]|uniref:Fringe-like glycosyltransferase domain-containing protein n=1 Tax=Clavelina lepadiformis TaxID=159417 RepID=A0ABP0FXU0_CLALP